MDRPPPARPDRHARRTYRLLLAGVLLALVAMWAAVADSLVEAREADIRAEQRVLERMVRAVRAQAQALFSLLDYFLASADLWCREHPDADPRTDPRFLELVAEFKSRSGGLVDIRLVSADGGLYYLGRADRQPLAQVEDRDYVRAQAQPGTRGLFIGRPVLSRVTGEWGLPVSYPLQARPHGMAVVFAAIENRLVTGQFEETRPHPNGTLTLAHRDGTILFRAPEADAIGKSVAGGWLWTRQLPRQAAGTFRVEAGVLDRRPRVGAYTTVPGYPLVTVASSDLGDVLAGWRRRMWTNLLAMGAVTLAGLVLLLRLVASLRSQDDLRLRLEQQANLDFLTGAASRRAFMAAGTRERARAGRHGRPLAVLMFDLDHFKQVNDRHGHPTGDRVLKAVAAAVQGELRSADLLGRLGGEEFAVLLPETGQDQAVEVAGRIRRRIEALALQSDRGQPVPVTVSLGAAGALGPDDRFDALLGRADAALYRAKQSGRNQVRAAGEPEAVEPRS